MIRTRRERTGSRPFGRPHSWHPAVTDNLAAATIHFNVCNARPAGERHINKIARQHRPYRCRSYAPTSRINLSTVQNLASSRSGPNVNADGIIRRPHDARTIRLPRPIGCQPAWTLQVVELPDPVPQPLHHARATRVRVGRRWGRCRRGHVRKRW